MPLNEWNLERFRNGHHHHQPEFPSHSIIALKFIKNINQKISREELTEQLGGKL
jgi:hypothetical protein